jgi:hypothetical protein
MLSLRHVSWGLIFTFLTCCGPAYAKDVSEVGLKGRVYEDVRRELIAKGYVPFRREQTDSLICSKSFCRDFPEVIACTSAGVAMCKFDYVRTVDRVRFVVTTRGEGKKIVVAVSRAESWEIEPGW